MVILATHLLLRKRHQVLVILMLGVAVFVTEIGVTWALVRRGLAVVILLLIKGSRLLNIWIREASKLVGSGRPTGFLEPFVRLLKVSGIARRGEGAWLATLDLFCMLK